MGANESGDSRAPSEPKVERKNRANVDRGGRMVRSPIARLPAPIFDRPKGTDVKDIHLDLADSKHSDGKKSTFNRQISHRRSNAMLKKRVLKHAVDCAGPVPVWQQELMEYESKLSTDPNELDRLDVGGLSVLAGVGDLKEGNKYMSSDSEIESQTTTDEEEYEEFVRRTKLAQAKNKEDVKAKSEHKGFPVIFKPTQRKILRESDFYSDDDSDDYDDLPEEVYRLSLDWVQYGKQIYRTPEDKKKIVRRQTLRIQSPPWRWTKKYFILYEDKGFWMFDDKYHSKEADQTEAEINKILKRKQDLEDLAKEMPPPVGKLEYIYYKHVYTTPTDLLRVKGELKQIEDKRAAITKKMKKIQSWQKKRPNIDMGPNFLLPNLDLRVDLEAEDEFALSGKEKETQFFVRGVHTHYSANNLELWRLEAQNKAEKAEMITAINLISNRLHEKRNREVQEEKLRKKMIGQSAVTPYEFIVWLIHDQLHPSVRNAWFVLYREYIDRETFFQWLLEANESVICHILKKNHHDTAKQILRHLVGLWDSWISLCPADMFSPLKWKSPGDFSRKFTKDRRDAKGNLLKSNSKYINHGIGDRLLSFLGTLHLCEAAPSFSEAITSMDPSKMHRVLSSRLSQVLRTIEFQLFVIKSKYGQAFGLKVSNNVKDLWELLKNPALKEAIERKWGERVEEIINGSTFGKDMNTLKPQALAGLVAFLKGVAMRESRALKDLLLTSHPEWIKNKIDEQVYLSVHQIKKRLKMLKKETQKPAKPFLVIGSTDPYIRRHTQRNTEQKPVRFSFEDLHRQNPKAIIRFFQRIDPHFLSDTKYADGILAFDSQTIAEQLMVHDIEILDKISLESLIDAHTNEDDDDVEVKCPHLQRAQQLFAKRVLWVAHEILRKNESDTDNSAHLESILKVMERFISIAEKSKNAEFANYFAIFSIVHAFSLDYISVHVRKLDEDVQIRLVQLKQSISQNDDDNSLTASREQPLYVPRLSSIVAEILELKKTYAERIENSKAKKKFNMNMLHEIWPLLRTIQTIKASNKLRQLCKTIPSVQFYLFAALATVPTEEDLIEHSWILMSAERLELLKENKEENKEKKEDDLTYQEQFWRIFVGFLTRTSLSPNLIVYTAIATILYTVILVIAFSKRNEYEVQYVRAFVVGSINFLFVFNFLYIYFFECRSFFAQGYYKASEVSIFADKNWNVWTVAIASFVGAAHFIADSFNGADVSIISDAINFYLMLVVANFLDFVVVITIMPYFIDTRPRTLFRYNTLFCTFVGFCVKMSVSLGVNSGVFGLVLAIFSTLYAMWEDRMNPGNNPDYLQFFSLVVLSLPTGLGRPLIVLQDRLTFIGDDQWDQVIFFAIWTTIMEIIRIVLLITFRKGIHNHEQSWVILFPLRMMDVMGTVVIFLDIRPNYGFLVCLGITLLKDLVRNSGVFYELQFSFINPYASSHEKAIYMVTWYNLCLQTVTSEIMACIMMVSVISTEIVVGDWIGYAVTEDYSQTERIERVVQYCLVLAAAFIAGQISIAYLAWRLAEAKRHLWRANRSVNREGLDLLKYPSLLNRKRGADDLDYIFNRNLKVKYMIFYVSMSMAIFGNLLYNYTLVDRLTRAGVLF